MSIAWGSLLVVCLVSIAIGVTIVDKQTVRAKRLDDGAHEVSRRLVEAMETVRTVLAK